MTTENLPPHILQIPKAELHVHVEGAITPEKCREIAARNHVALDPALFTPDGAGYAYADFLDSVTRVYYGIASTLKTGADYDDVTYDYLKRCAAENTAYVEMIACPAQAVRCGIPYAAMIDGMARGIDRARAGFGIESRINVTFEREFAGSDTAVAAKAERDADTILSYPHTYIVGLDIAGGEREGDIPPFRPAYDRVLRDFGRPLGIRMHAAENAGPGNARDALAFNVTRIGHGVRSIEDFAVLRAVTAGNILLEICPTSNVLAGIYPSYAAHPLRRLMDAGVRVGINSDDPGLFMTSIGREYQIAHENFGLSEGELLRTTRDSIAASFADSGLKTSLLQKIQAYEDGIAKRPAAKHNPSP